ncbi:Predicted dehydrogenase [Saccharicrinis carchari]|uniref:Predicted dehydrogenase n=2 Tax=Saccharicrinis carchari TaxID=1168039 RepID=A0A521AWP6_SACCC|nr:Predicted dehydrogenase [Saccharicrinis carchari]
MTKIINWGIIGCGNVCEVKSGPAFNKVNHSNLVAVMRRNAEKVRDYAERHKVAHFYTDADQLIQSPQVNAIYVATPPSTHAQYAIAAMRAGKPVYVEKPMAKNYAECLAMNQVAKETGMPLFVAYYRRTLPGFLKAKQLIDENAIGRPLAANLHLTRPAKESEKNKSWRIDPSIAGGGIFYDLASHQLDLLDFLLGPITQAIGFTANNNPWYEAEDTISASFKFASGVVGSGTWSFVTHDKATRDSIELIGTQGSLRLSCFTPDPIQLITDKGTTEFPYLNPENIQYNLIKQVTESILQGKEAISDGISAARTNRVMEQIIKSIDQ